MLWCFHLFNTSTIRQVNILLDGRLTEYTQITLSVYKYDKGRQQQPKFHSFITHPHSEPRYKRDRSLELFVTISDSGGLLQDFGLEFFPF